MKGVTINLFNLVIHDQQKPLIFEPAILGLIFEDWLHLDDELHADEPTHYVLRVFAFTESFLEGVQNGFQNCNSGAPQTVTVGSSAEPTNPQIGGESKQGHQPKSWIHRGSL